MKVQHAALVAFVSLSSTLIAGSDADRPISSPPPAEFSPMTGYERLGRYVTGLGNPQALFLAAASAGIGQANGTPKEWGGGAEGYGLRIGGAFTNPGVRYARVLGAPATPHEDNR